MRPVDSPAIPVTATGARGRFPTAASLAGLAGVALSAAGCDRSAWPRFGWAVDNNSAARSIDSTPDTDQPANRTDPDTGAP
ncbi:hypothetical protein GCM10023170_077920 [Phytohabitans houttuyneae]|uniref:Uncharacterized protein n=1 Tax=Phytohabitans houttuyneae TaxID=1076126 RepID=A0A6V8K2B5_9ACTN|nr:hypothetical protein Phou_020240 [Phytohabitans houttuyneae]